MRLSYRTQGAGDYTEFGDTEAGDLVVGFSPKMQSVAQVTPLFRAAHQFVSARNNRVWSLEGVVEKAHADEETAVAFIQGHAAAWPDSVDILIEEGDTAIVLTPAVLVAFEPLPKGVSTVIKYGFVGAALTVA